MKRKINLEAGSALRERERERERERVSLFSEQIGAKGGSREHRDVVILPRDLK